MFKKYFGGIEVIIIICYKKYVFVVLGDIEILSVEYVLGDVVVGFRYIISVCLFFFWWLECMVFFG